MRRAAVLFALAMLPAAGAAAQATRPTVTVGLSAPDPRTGAREPIVRLQNLRGDPRWTEALDRSLPVVVTHKLELWRSRDGWIDEFRFNVEYQIYLTKEPLQDEYAVTVVTQNRPSRPLRFTERDSAFAYLERPNRVQVSPRREGEFYYVVTTRITPLTDADIDQIERFLAGEPDLDVSDGGGTVLGRGIRRLLLRIAGLPSEVITARSERFAIRGPQE